MMNMKTIGMYAAHPDKMENCNGVENVGSSPTMPTMFFDSAGNDWDVA